MQNERLAALYEAGVSIWIDDLDRHRIESGNLQQLIDTKSVVGVTTNPSIFEKAMTSGLAEYQPQLAELAISGASAEEAVRALTVHDVSAACDIFLPVWEKSGHVDGRVSLEVDPRLANDTAGTIAQAQELWLAVNRPNLMIKIPATRAGLPAITETLAAGISVNVTLIFSQARYLQVLDAWLAGLEKAEANRHDLSLIESVASFFVSRVDTLVDKELDALGTPQAAAVRGKAAIANAHLAWQAFLEVTAGQRWKDLQSKGAHVQRPLWASTGVKDPTYEDTRYVVELVASNTVNTMPEATLNAVADHGVVRGDTVTGTSATARQVWADLAELGVSADAVFTELETDGVSKFIAAWEQLLASIETALQGAK
ncbi:MAG: transaldolase [Actinobacteria bacterium]|nr:transaldolase [Actinomycetota bacterium]NBY15496.1 transaldolase [Actinomycetota bacterium]